VHIKFNMIKHPTYTKAAEKGRIFGFFKDKNRRNVKTTKNDQKCMEQQSLDILHSA